MSVKITTTGTLDPVPLADLGKIPGFPHPTSDEEMVGSPWARDEIPGSADAQAALNASTSVATPLRLIHGTYTGDGTESQAITGIGFAPTYVRIWERKLTDGGIEIWETTSEIVDDNASGAAIKIKDKAEMKDNGITSLDADGFTVDDDAGGGGGKHPNKSARIYNYMVMG